MRSRDIADVTNALPGQYPDTLVARGREMTGVARVARGYGPGQRRYRPPLESVYHFGTIQALRQRQDELANYKLPRDLEVVRDLWGATYTQAIYTKKTIVGLRTLLAQIELLERALDVVASRLVERLDGMTGLDEPVKVERKKRKGGYKRRAKKETN